MTLHESLSLSGPPILGQMIFECLGSQMFYEALFWGRRFSSRGWGECLSGPEEVFVYFISFSQSHNWHSTSSGLLINVYWLPDTLAPYARQSLIAHHNLQSTNISPFLFHRHILVGKGRCGQFNYKKAQKKADSRHRECQTGSRQ